jgi:hypothetical protein
VQYFSVNAASELTERDRRTIKKALKGVKPDSYVRKSPRWKMATILDAMEAHAAKSSYRNDDHDEIPHDWREQREQFHRELDRERTTLPLFAKFNAQFDMLKATKSAAKRRQMLGSLMLLADATHHPYVRHYEKLGRPGAGGFTEAPNEARFSWIVDLVAEAAELPTTKVWDAYFAALPPEEE